MAVRALVLLSGGLDSLLAARLLQEQGLEVQCLGVQTPFLTEGFEERLRRIARRAGLPLRVVRAGEEYLELVRRPRHGYGQHLNPCIDCHALMCRVAAGQMRELGCAFVATGEVLGQRPLSQRREALRIVDRESGLEGLVLRPLSAKLLEPTLAELRGWVDRERLLDLRGRSRKVQMELAARFGLREYATPAGGCLLTDPGFCRRLADLMERRPGFDLNDVELLKWGRHLRIGPALRLVIARRAGEARRLVGLARRGDLLLWAPQDAALVGLARGEPEGEGLQRAAAVLARYLRAPSGEVEVRWRQVEGPEGRIRVRPCPPERVARLLL